MAATMTTAQITAAVQVSLAGKQAAQGVTSPGLNPPENAQTATYLVPLITGTGSGAIDTIICRAFELAASASNTHNLNDGTLLDLFGAAGGISNIKYILIQMIANSDASTVSSGITIGNAAANIQKLWFGTTSDTWKLNSTTSVPFQAGDLTGKTVSGAACNVKVLNDDAVNKATYLLIVGGVHT